MEQAKPNQFYIQEEIDLSKTQNSIKINLEKSGRDLTRTEICKLTGIARTTVYDNLNILIRKGIVKKYSGISNNKGRPKVYFNLI